jgi:HEAT repeat protein
MTGAPTLTPEQRITLECARRGRQALVADCVALLHGRYSEVDDRVIVALGGDHNGQMVLLGYNYGKAGYWPRVWAARGLLHAWEPAATEAIIHATADDAWRVREMAAKVIALYRVGEALDAVAALRTDSVPRVRAAAERAVRLLTADSA